MPKAYFYSSYVSTPRERTWQKCRVLSCKKVFFAEFGQFYGKRANRVVQYEHSLTQTVKPVFEICAFFKGGKGNPVKVRSMRNCRDYTETFLRKRMSRKSFKRGNRKPIEVYNPEYRFYERQALGLARKSPR